MAIPCIECGTPNGPIKGTKNPRRISGARFGLEGKLCWTCYNRLAYRLLRNTEGWKRLPYKKRPRPYIVKLDSEGTLEVRLRIDDTAKLKPADRQLVQDVVNILARFTALRPVRIRDYIKRSVSHSWAPLGIGPKGAPFCSAGLPCQAPRPGALAPAGTNGG